MFIEEKHKELDEKIAVVNERRAEAIEGEWHARIPENLTTDPIQLGSFIQDEVFFQFSHHFKNLQNGEITRRKTQGFPLERTVTNTSIKLMELEYRQRQDTNALREMNRIKSPKNEEIQQKHTQIVRRQSSLIDDPIDYIQEFSETATPKFDVT